MQRQNARVTLIVFTLAAFILSACATPPTPTSVPPKPTGAPPTAVSVPPTATTVPPAPQTATSLPPTPPVPPTAVVAPAATSAPAAASGVTITWFGQSMFTLKVANGPLVMIDPVNASAGYKVAPISGVDVVAISHEHADHNNLALAPGASQVLRGLAGTDWARIDETVKGARIRTVSVYHDSTQGSARGKNAVFVIEANGLKIVHLGDLGHLLSPEQITAIGPVDIAIIPVGGNYTIDPTAATQVANSLKPSVVIPMHYKTAVSTSALGPVDAFLTDKTVQRVTGNQITFSAAALPKAMTVFLLGYE
jgi:L-ascorbate metabolism protein UlaG (beta-lactamase superfamily)